MRVLVVGAGVVGLSSAYRLARAGCEVTVLDAHRAGAAASHGNAAKIAVSESGPVPAPGVLLQGLRWLLKRDSPLALRPSLSPGFAAFLLRMARHCNEPDFRRGLEVLLTLAADANDLFDDYTADGMRFEMHSAGVILAFETRDRFDEHCQALDIYEGFGHTAEVLHGDAVREREPVLSERIRHGLRFPGDRQIEPDSLTEGLLQRIAELGGTVLEDTAVETIERAPTGEVTGVVTADGERLRGDALLLAAGVWARQLSGQLGSPLPIYPGKGYSLDYRPAPVPLRHSLTLEDARVAVTPLDGMIRLAGTMELGGSGDTIAGPRVAGIRRAARESFVGWDDPPGEGTPWAGMRPLTPDGLPVIGRVDGCPNAYVASGHGMLGLTLAPATAEVITAMVTGQAPGVSDAVVEAVSPARFARRKASGRDTTR
ncbi:NAD(P)/FAD-dependent oxidoreductase [Ornithinimicrobium cavernae]|uniref:NAD(P)/FAD-dependent oxidoreductase n=1 Tax=Ornithinimicrobium cavernae TaxID=2666047 RepID=UPI000D692F55|nr:FAD-dependent oxidoreductase [Ornithinimicrobium cavernae]